MRIAQMSLAAMEPTHEAEYQQDGLNLKGKKNSYL